MKYPELPEFDIPPACQSSSRDMTPEEYAVWIGENVKRLRELGIYDKLQRDPSRTPANERFILE